LFFNKNSPVPARCASEESESGLRLGIAFKIASIKYGNIVTTFLPPSRANG